MKISLILIVTIILALLSVMISAQISDFKERGGPQAGDFKERGRGRGRGRGRRPPHRGRGRGRGGFGSCNTVGATRCADIRGAMCTQNAVPNTCVCYRGGTCRTLRGTNACMACGNSNAITARENFVCRSHC